MKLFRTLAVLSLLLLLLSACSRNFYSSKASRNCGCPGQHVR